MNAPAPFSQILRAECQEDWQAAIQHRFVDEIFAGTLASEHLRHYLVQDYQFVDRFVALLGATSLIQSWKGASSFFMPRGHSLSTSTRVPSPASAGA